MSVVYKDTDGNRTEIYKGCVIADRERNFRDDSDFYVLVWNEEKGEVTTVEYATTRYGGGGTATVDITPENKAKADAWAYKLLRRTVWDDYMNELAKPKKGDIVTVVKGRKVPKGTRGRLFWIGEKRVYGGYSRWSQSDATRCGIALTEDKDEKGRYTNVAWTYLENLEADGSLKFKYSEAKWRLKAAKRAGAWGWYSSLMARASMAMM